MRLSHVVMLCSNLLPSRFSPLRSAHACPAKMTLLFRLRQDWSTEHPGDEAREQCGLPRPPGLGGGDQGGNLGDTSPHGGRGPSARHRGSAADGASNGGGAHQNGIGVSQQELNRSSTHPAVSPHATVKTRSTPRRAGGHDGGGGPAEPLRQGPHNPLRQRSVGWAGDAAHGEGAALEQLRRGSLPELGGGSYSSPGGAPVMHRTSWHGQQQQQQQVMSQMLALAAQPPPPPPSPHQQQQQQQQHFAGLLPGPPPPPPPRVLSPHARVAQTVSQGINGCQPMVPFGSPTLRSRLTYDNSIGSQSLDHPGFGVPTVSLQAGAFDDSALNMLLQSQMGLDGDGAAGDSQVCACTAVPYAHSQLCSASAGICMLTRTVSARANRFTLIAPGMEGMDG